MTISIGSILPVGTIIHSMLSATQFSTEYGDNWVLMDGRSVTGSKYASVTGNTTIPDARGAFLRAKGATYNPDGDLALGTHTADKLEAHTHSTTNAITFDIIGSAIYLVQKGSGSTVYSANTNSTGGNETSPESITVNVFIRIN